MKSVSDAETEPGGLRWQDLKNVFWVAPTLRREYWDRLFSRLGLNEQEIKADDQFYERLLYSFRRDTAFMFEVNAAFLESGKRKDRERAFFPRARKWLKERPSLPLDPKTGDPDDVRTDPFGEGTPEYELRGFLIRLKRFEENRAIQEAARTESEWKAAAARLRGLLDRLEPPTVEAIQSAEEAAAAFLEASRQYLKEAAAVERDRKRVKTVLEAFRKDERVAAVLERLESLDARRLAKLAAMAAPSSDDIARLKAIADETAAGEAEFARLAAEGASWAAIRDRASAMADLEAEREALEQGLSSILDKIAAAVEPAEAADTAEAGEPRATAVPGVRRRRRRTVRAGAAQAEEEAPPAPATCADEPGVAMPATWEEFPAWCEEQLADRLVLSPRAQNTIKKTQYDDVETAAKCLSWLAGDYRSARLDGGGRDLRGPFESGLWNERCGGDSFPFDWNGKRVEVGWHVKNGGNTTDPARCLRIYYFWDEAGKQVVVASMPDHIPNGAV